MVKSRLNDPLSKILKESTDLFGTALEQVEWAESVIEAAIARHPDQGDLLYHGFGLLMPTHRLMTTEFVSRSHFRELLVRLATGQDTRPGTAAEVCCACADASQVAPLTSTAAGLYFRMWESAFPDKSPVTDRAQHHEALDGSSIDALEATSRRTLARKERIVGDITCAGMHHGVAVPCTYADTGAGTAKPRSPKYRQASRPGPAEPPPTTPVPKDVHTFRIEQPSAPRAEGLDL